MKSIKSHSLSHDSERPFKPLMGYTQEDEKKSYYGNIRGNIQRRGGFSSGNKGLIQGRGVARGKIDPLRQRVSVKVRYKRHTDTEYKSLKLHTSYLKREGTGKDEGKGILFNEKGELSSELLSDRLKTWEKDRHHWRIVVSPERGSEIDLEKFTKRFIDGLKRDLVTDLEWISAIHYDTEHPHIHVLVRGKSDNGADLVIKKGYIAYGMRDMAENLATKELGPRTEKEIEHALLLDVERERVGEIDKKLLFEVKKSENGVIDLNAEWNVSDSFIRSLKIKRLKFLLDRGLSKKIAPGKWQLHSDTEKILRELSIQNDIIKSMHKKMKEGREREEFIPGVTESIKGELLYRGFINDLYDSSYLLIKGEDKDYSVRLSRYSEVDGMEAHVGDIITVSTTGFFIGKIDEFLFDASKEYQGELNNQKLQEYIEKRKDIRKNLPTDMYFQNVEKRIKTLLRKEILREEEGVLYIPQNLKELIKDKEQHFVKVSIDKRKEQGLNIG